MLKKHFFALAGLHTVHTNSTIILLYIEIYILYMYTQHRPTVYIHI